MAAEQPPGDQGGAAPPAPPSGPTPDPTRPRWTAAEAAAFPANTIALTVVPDAGKVGKESTSTPESWEMGYRSRLAGAMIGVAGPLHQMVGESAMSHLDVEGAKGIVFALAGDVDDPVVHLQAQLAAATYVAFSRTAGALGRATAEVKSGDKAKAVHELARGMGVLERAFRRTTEAVEAARARESQRTSVPRFTVCTIVGPGGTRTA